MTQGSNPMVLIQIDSVPQNQNSLQLDGQYPAPSDKLVPKEEIQTNNQSDA